MACRPGGSRFTIAHISDLHCGGPYFVPNLMERAISEINDLSTRSGRLLGRPDHVRVQARVRAGEGVPRPAGVQARSSSSPETTTHATSATSTSRSCSASAARCCASATSTVVAVDSTEPDLDHGQIGRGPLPLDRGAVRRRLRSAHLRPPPPPAAGAGDGPRAERRLRRRRRARVPPARTRADRPLGAQARPVRMAAREHVHPQRGHRLVAPAQREHSALLQRDRGRGGARLGLAAVPVPRPGADHPVLDRDARVREVHRPDRGRALVAKAEPRGRRDRRGALPAGRPRRARRAALSSSSPPSSPAGPRSCAAARTTALPLGAGLEEAIADAPARRRRRPLRRARARAAGSASRSPAARSRPASRTSAPTSASTRPRSSRSRCPRWP